MTIDNNKVRFSIRRFLAAAVVSALCGFTVLAAYGPGRGSMGEGPLVINLTEPRVVILKSRRVLHLFDGEQLVRSYPIDLGLAPIGDKRLAGDGRTPEGLFRIVTKNPASPFHRFLGIDYPHADAVKHGLASGLITLGEAAAILKELQTGVCPDWSTSLGGGLGIHGAGGRGFDWTAGCVALADSHSTELFDALRIGDSVEILP